MLLYKQIAQEWDRLNRLPKDEASLLEETIEDGVFHGFGRFTEQLMDKMLEAYPETNNLIPYEIQKMKDGIANALFSGYLIYIAYQNLLNIKRPQMRLGIQYIPTLMDEYNYIVAPYQPNTKSLLFNQLLDEEPAIELLFEKVATIEMNIIRKNYPQIDDIPFGIGYMLKDLINRGVFIGFGLGYSENSLRS
ncbi:MAG TPA: hypothetical protein PLJ10_05060 [Candidatus Hydrogenedens sp.]|nr:hypothetical protein [Candidatus Hydrogenedens sp.]